MPMSEYDVPSSGLAERIAARRKRLQMEAEGEVEPMAMEVSDQTPEDSKTGAVYRFLQNLVGGMQEESPDVRNRKKIDRAMKEQGIY